MTRFCLQIKPTEERLQKKYGERPNHADDIGVDLFTPYTIVCPAKETTKIDLGVQCRLLDAKHDVCVGYMLAPRSSIVKTPLRMANSIGIVDPQYRGNLIAVVDNRSDEAYTVQADDRLFQVVSFSGRAVGVKVVTELDETTRGSAGFGSTGK